MCYQKIFCSSEGNYSWKVRDFNSGLSDSKMKCVNDVTLSHNCVTLISINTRSFTYTKYKRIWIRRLNQYYFLQWLLPRQANPVTGAGRLCSNVPPVMEAEP